MKSRSSTGSPLRRWLIGHDARPHVEASECGTAAATDSIVLAHWILYGVRPSAEGMSYWGQKLDGRSLFEVMHTMYRSSAPNRQFEWRRFYRAMGVGGARSEKARRSPALAAIHVHLAYDGTEPEPQIVAGYLRALLRRPVDMGSFSGHVVRRVLRRRGEMAGRSSARMPFARPIPVDVIRSEVLLLEAIAQPNHHDDVFGFLVRALTPVPDGPLEMEVVETKPPVGKFDRILTAANVDLRKLERDLLTHARSEKKDISESHADFLLNSIHDQIEDRSPGLLLVILYRLLLRRDPEESGYTYHLAALKEGRVTPKAVVVDFLKSTEFKSKRDSIGGHDGA